MTFDLAELRRPNVELEITCNLVGFHCYFGDMDLFCNSVIAKAS